jgi:hypothetical protein
MSVVSQCLGLKVSIVVLTPSPAIANQRLTIGLRIQDVWPCGGTAKAPVAMYVCVRLGLDDFTRVCPIIGLSIE